MKRLSLIIGCFSASLFLFPAQAPAAPDMTKTYNKAIQAAAKEDYAAARKAAKETADPKLFKLIEWMRLTNTKESPTFSEAERFMQKNPNWPRLYMIRRNAEQALLKDGKKNALEQWFKKHPPVSTPAVLKQVEILLEKKEWEKAVPMIHSLWRRGDFSPEEAAAIREKFDFLLDERDFAARTEKLLDERNASLAKDLLSQTDEDSRRLAQARIELILNTSKAKKAVKELTSRQQKDKGILFDQVRWHRANKRYDDAAKLLKHIPADKQTGTKWWTERSVLIRQFLSDDNPDEAYALAKNHTLKRGGDYADAEWLAGWIALRNLKKRPAAAEHFKRMLSAVSSPLSVSRGEYWLGRTYEEMNKKKEAAEWYEKASEKITTIYGQLAAAKLSGKKQLPPLPAETVPSKAHMDKLKKSELFAVMKMLENAKLYDLVDLFATRLLNDSKTPEEAAALAHVVANDLKREDIAVMISRRARQSGTYIVTLGYPVWELEHDDRAEPAIILSIIRQESSFASHAVSPAGARGLMQIMPATARQMAQKKKKAFSLQRLNASRDFNVDLGSTYLADLIKRFNGSYILAIAAYNAGPTNVNRWLRSIGTPGEDIDPIDWIERIPFGETRNYVHRVLENLHIYRRHMNIPEEELTVWTQKEKNS